MRIVEPAYAKINLTLEVLGRRSDGYHELRSLVAFAEDARDFVTLDADAPLAVSASGPAAGEIDGENLILSLVRCLQETCSSLRVGQFHLEKHLPVASGIGGGSADAAAAARAVARLNNIDDPTAVFGHMAAKIGADIPVCLGGGGCAAALMTGIGETVWRPADAAILPDTGVPAVLVNPRVAVSTAAVFKQLSAQPLPDDWRAPPTALPFDWRCEMARVGNDLERPARDLVPGIGAVLSSLDAQPGCELARMSGSGATCFGLFHTRSDAEAAADHIAREYPDWWVVPTRLR